MVQKDKILVVDDEVVIRELLSEVLADDGYTVESASNGRAALDLLKNSDDYVILFTDILMPGMNGIDLLREAKKLRPSLIPIVMTAYATLETARAAVKEGAYDYVLKPFSLSEIKLAVANALERHRLARENARLLELTQLFHISEQIATIRDENHLLSFLLKTALQRVNARRGSILVTSNDGKTLEIRAGVGLPQEVIGAAVDLERSISGMVAKSGKPLLINDLREFPQLARLSRQLEETSFISVPLEQKNYGNGSGEDSTGNHRIIAVLNVCQKNNGQHFTEGDLKTLSILANHAAAALQNVRLIEDIEHAHLATIESMALLLEARDPYTQFHSQRVRDVSVAIAVKLGIPPQEIEVLRLGAAFHDIGKVGVPDSVLNKPDKLTPEEWGLIRKHPIIGYSVLEPIHFLKRGHLDLVRGHHERLNGNGYPDGIKANELPPLVRVIAVADTYDAMASDRAYRKAMPPERIIEELTKASGEQLDPQMVEVLISLIRSGEITNLNKKSR